MSALPTRFPRRSAGAALTALFLTGTGGCLGEQAPLEPLPAGGLHVLYIGNSLTNTNDLPATVAAIGALAGDTIRSLTVAEPNLALIDHLNGASRAVEAIALGGWDFVILQQGPTSTGGICQDSLILWTQLFEPRIRAVGATPALFMVWPSSDRVAFFDNVRDAYQLSAQAVNGVFLPAGEAWRSAWGVDSTLPLYGPDGFHPSTMGSFLAALTIYERLSGRDVRTLPPTAFAAGSPIAMNDSTVRLLQAAAHDAIVRFPSSAAGTTGQAAARLARRGVRC